MRLLVMILTIILFVGGCAQGQQQQQSQTKSPNQAKSQAQSQSKSISKKGTQEPECDITPHRNKEAEQTAETIVKQVKGVDAAIAVFIDDELDVAVKVSNFNRFRMPEIRKESFQRLRSFYPDIHIHVSSDGKIYDLLEKLSKEEWSEKKACEQKKKLKSIEKKMRG